MAEKRKSTLVRILIALGAIIGFVLVLVLGFVFWVSRPGELIEPTRLVSAEATGYAEWTLRMENPGTEGFLRLLTTAISEMPSDVEDALPPLVRGWLSSTQNSRIQNQLEEALPAVVVWTMQPGGNATADDLHLLSVSARHLGNRLVLTDWMAGFVLGRSPNVTVHSYHDENIYELQVPARMLELSFFARRGAVFATSDLDTARQAVDLLAESETAAPSRPASALEGLFGGIGAEHTLRAAVTGGNETARLWETLVGAPPPGDTDWRSIKGATLTGDLQADGSFEGTLMLLSSDPALASHSPGIVSALQERLADKSIDAVVQSVPDSSGLRIDLRVPALVESLAEGMRRSNRRP